MHPHRTETDPLPETLSVELLLVEDSPFQARFLQQVLKRSQILRFEVTHVQRLDQALTAVARQKYDVLLVDLVLPDALELEAVVRLARAAPETPIVVATQLDDEDLGVRALEAGAQSVLVKDDSLERVLVRALRYAMGRHRYLVALQESRRDAYHQATHDRLTRLPNRHLLMDRLQVTMDFAARHGRKLAVHFVDLDRFKEINDTLGHAEGDRILYWMAERLSTCVRASDTVARFAGDEIVVVQRDLSGSQAAEHMAGKLLAALAVPDPDGPRVPSIGASIGIAVYPDHARSAEGLLRQADDAMYRAKAAGGGCFRFSEGEAGEPREGSLRWPPHAESA